MNTRRIDFYRLELADIPPLSTITTEIRAGLLTSIKSGDIQAKEQFFKILLPVILRYADYMCSGRRAGVDHAELLSLGNVTLVEYFEQALEKENPVAYLLKCSKLKMMGLLHWHADCPIALPQSDGVEPPVCVPIDHMADDFDIPEPEPVVQKEDTRVQDAIQRLPEKHQDLVRRAFGIGQMPEDLTQIAGCADSREPAYEKFKSRKRTALVKLRRILEHGGDR